MKNIYLNVGILNVIYRSEKNIQNRMIQNDGIVTVTLATVQTDVFYINDKLTF